MKPTDVSSSEVFAWANERLARQRVPLPTQPRAGESEFTFPEDPDALTTAELGQKMLQLAAYAAYTQRLLGGAESEFVLVESEYRLKVNANGIALRESEEFGKRPSAEVIEAAVLKNNEELTPIYKRRLELLSIKAQLVSRLSVYEFSWKALSRELSRREMEANLTRGRGE